MSKEDKVLAFDLGGSSGRAVIGSFDGSKIELKEIHRFSNDPVTINETMYWDVLRLFYEIKQGLLKAKKYGKINSIGIDTWGVDFGLIDKEGRLLENPVHYRDKRTKGMMEKSFKKIDKKEFYKITGNEFMEINTAFQLLYLVENRRDLLERVDKMLFIPDLFNYFLSGVKSTEYSIASTSQLLNINKCIWSDRVISALGIPKNILPDIIDTGNKIGELKDEICKELGIEKTNVISIASHDTESALLSVLAQEEDYIFISCGTWSLFGTELKKPMISEKSSQYNITNEIGYNKKHFFLKNIIGLWLIQESRRQWIKEGKEFDFGELEKMAKEAKPMKCFIDPDAEEFMSEGNIPKKIQEFCIRTKQEVPETIGEIVRCINESLGFKYRYALDQIKDCTNKLYKNIYMIGGGVQSSLLCQLTANICNCNVIAGPIEATTIGNITLQLIADKKIDSLKEAKDIIRNSQDTKNYYPENSDVWEISYKRFKNIISK